MLILVRRNALISASASPTTSTSPISTFPAVGSIRRLTQRTKVDLPLPDNPMTTNVSRASDAQVDVVQADGVPGVGENLILAGPVLHPCQHLPRPGAEYLVQILDFYVAGPRRGARAAAVVASGAHHQSRRARLKRAPSWSDRAGRRMRP